MAKTSLWLSIVLLAACLSRLSTQHPVQIPSPSGGFVDSKGLPKRDRTYKHYSGPAQNFPGVDTWSRYDFMWNLKKATLSSGGNTKTDVTYMKKAIDDCSNQYRVDRRLILGIIMQESLGNVGVVTTYSNGLPTAGLMQCIECPGFPDQHGLSQSDITSMICGGTKHFKKNMDNWGNKWSRMTVYPALREYNSGIVNEADLNDSHGATASYVSDIANRVTGWSG